MWQAERHLECSGCGVPRDQAWAVYGPERQREQQQQAEQALERRLCVYCKTQEDDRSRKRSAADDPSQLFGWHWVFSG